MAGHSKWANIKHRKERADAVKGKIFSRLTKELISAVKQGGSDPKSNAKLRLVIQKAKAANLPHENIERNIKKAASQDQADFTEIVYELYGHNGVGIIAEGMTDNRNRLASDIRIATNKRGGTIANPGAVTFNFEHKGVIQISRSLSEEELFLLATESGAEDFEIEEDCYVILTRPETLYAVKEALEEKGVTCEEATLERIPKVYVECIGEAAQANLALIEWLENIDDLDRVFHNMRMPEEPSQEASS